MFIISFVVIYILFYLLRIGTTNEVKDGKISKKAGWKYPLALSLIIWLIWHFYLYPPINNQDLVKIKPEPNIRHSEFQRINLMNWT